MEHSLHKKLKEVYCTDGSTIEVPFGDYRIDVVSSDSTLIEIQHGSLSAIKPKCIELLAEYKMHVVKPLIRSKQLVKLDKKGGDVLSTRRSPKTGRWLDAFEELVYFSGVFPHKNLTLEFLLVDVREIRYAGHGRRRRRRENDFQVEDLELVEIVDSVTMTKATDLFQWLPFDEIPKKFGTSELAECMSENRSDVQKITYCLRETGAIRQTGKRGNAILYERPVRRRKIKTPKSRRISAG